MWKKSNKCDFCVVFTEFGEGCYRVVLQRLIADRRFVVSVYIYFNVADIIVISHDLVTRLRICFPSLCSTLPVTSYCLYTSVISHPSLFRIVIPDSQDGHSPEKRGKVREFEGD